MATTIDPARPVLEVADLRVAFATRSGWFEAVRGVDLALAAGETLALVGESGSGKSTLGLSLMGLLHPTRSRTSGSVRLDGRELVGAAPAELRALRGREIAMAFQNSMTALNPVHPVGRQVAEAMLLHQDVTRRQARARAVELLGEVGIADPAQRARDYPHQLSGGMRQRVMIAIALVNEPKVLIADEPTTALDVTTQAQLLELIGALQQRLGIAVLLVTHDLGVAARIAERVAVMYAGRIVERAPSEPLFRHPRHPYTWGLLGSIPGGGATRHRRLDAIPGSPPASAYPGGCPFHPRCAHAFDACSTTVPQLRPAADPQHEDACLLAAEVKDRIGAERGMRVEQRGATPPVESGAVGGERA
jgi:oligopeptide/dipeptide ABC transporter ATP-binding protein